MRLIRSEVVVGILQRHCSRPGDLFRLKTYIYLPSYLKVDLRSNKAYRSTQTHRVFHTKYSEQKQAANMGDHHCPSTISKTAVSTPLPATTPPKLAPLPANPLENVPAPDVRTISLTPHMHNSLNRVDILLHTPTNHPSRNSNNPKRQHQTPPKSLHSPQTPRLDPSKSNHSLTHVSILRLRRSPHHVAPDPSGRYHPTRTRTDNR